MRLARWVFFLSGVTGILLVVPPFFLERQTGEDNPPPITHPEYYYGFFGVTLAWQFLFLVIASDPVRYRRAVPPAMLQKASFAVAIPLLYAAGRVAAVWIGFASMSEKFAHFAEQWKPKIVGELNGQLVKLVKFQWPFVWHHHDHEDELFLVVKGRFRMELRDRTIGLEEGDFLIVPRGVEHRPVADEEAHVLLFEPASTLNTGNVRDERTLEQLDRL